MLVQAIYVSLRVKLRCLFLQLFCTCQQIKIAKHNDAIKTALASQ